MVRLTPGLLERLPDLVEPAVARGARESRRAAGSRRAGPDGRVRVVVPVETVEHAVGTLLRLGAEAEVVAPAEPREQMARTVGAPADTYLRPPPTARPQGS